MVVSVFAPRRCLVIGCGGAGKTTFSRELGARTGLPVVHLDRLYWRAGWEPTPADEWRRTVAELVGRPAWIMDGNYGGTFDLRLHAADAVYFLDTPRRVCLARVLRRWWRYRGSSRPSMAEGCPDRITGSFLHWIWSYRSHRRPEILRRLGELGDTRVRIVTSKDDRERALAEVAAPEAM
ncbi:MAG: adenylate kinase [Gemmatimonadetes bacterium]|nr:adenylate kinase [Gemmatimonadota bacterium]